LKKIILVVTLVAITALIYYYFTYVYGWMEFRKNTDTPDRFLSTTIVKKEIYTKDKIKISQELKVLLLKHDEFFVNSAYFQGTEILIDTIVYSPDLKKLGILILTKNPTSRQLMPAKNESYYYDATAYLCVRQEDTFELSWLGPNFSNSDDSLEISEDIRDACFRTFVSKDTTEKYSYKYNLNDTRFWTSTVWQRIEEGKIKGKEFEEEKIKHPENIYEPPK